MSQISASMLPSGGQEAVELSGLLFSISNQPSPRIHPIMIKISSNNTIVFMQIPTTLSISKLQQSPIESHLLGLNSKQLFLISTTYVCILGDQANCTQAWGQISRYICIFQKRLLMLTLIRTNPLQQLLSFFCNHMLVKIRHWFFQTESYIQPLGQSQCGWSNLGSTIL